MSMLFPNNQDSMASLDPKEVIDGIFDKKKKADKKYFTTQKQLASSKQN